MPATTIDGLEVDYITRGTGPALLMLAPGGIDAIMEKWRTAGVWKGMQPLDALAKDFHVIAYDRRESGNSGGRVGRPLPARDAAEVGVLARAGTGARARSHPGVRPRTSLTRARRHP